MSYRSWQVPGNVILAPGKHLAMSSFHLASTWQCHPRNLASTWQAPGNVILILASTCHLAGNVILAPGKHLAKDRCRVTYK
jgi:hypothetical protein